MARPDIDDRGLAQQRAGDTVLVCRLDALEPIAARQLGLELMIIIVDAVLPSCEWWTIKDAAGRPFGFVFEIFAFVFASCPVRRSNEPVAALT